MADRPVGTNVPLDTDAVSPDSIVAAVTFGISRMKTEADGRREALDWSSVQIALEVDAKDPSTTHLQVRAHRLVS